MTRDQETERDSLGEDDYHERVSRERLIRGTRDNRQGAYSDDWPLTRRK
jgi:hypothetical protein